MDSFDNQYAGLDPLVVEYLQKKRDAEAKADRVDNIANIGNVADSAVSAMIKPTIYQNNWQAMGQAPKIQAAPEVKNDFTGLQEQAQHKLATANSDASMAVQQAMAQKKAELMERVAAKKAEAENNRYTADNAHRRKVLEETVRHNRAMEGKTQGTSLNDPLASIPKELRDNYLSSESKVKEFDQALSDVDPLIAEAQTFTLADKLTPNAFGGKDFDSIQAKIAGAIMNRVPGIRSDADFRNIVVPMIPQPSDTPTVAKDKADGLRLLLKSSRPVNEVGNVYKPSVNKITVSNGTETLEIDASDLADAEQDGYKRIK